jgi:predicted DNA-binding protein with PD1-like motif
MEAAAQACLLSGATACHMLTAVGSLSRVTLRLASATATSTRTTASSGSSGSNPLRTWTEPVEVTSLVGTMTAAGDGGKHWHMSIADAAGNSFGGHVMEATVWTTMEIVLGTIGNGVSFSREMDTATGYRELVVRQGQRQEQEQQQGREENEEHEDEDVEEQIAAIRREARRGKRKRR